MNDDKESDGFFSALGEIFSNYGFAMSSMLILFMLIAGGVGYTINARRQEEDEFASESKTVEAELLDD
ncbi:MAG: hypothetical protein ISP82_07745 [Candidatus Poseidoniaceae archaeon]|nr:hypothetical protein [Candidatus Poseidoniaceae archaeon]